MFRHVVNCETCAFAGAVMGWLVWLEKHHIRSNSIVGTTALGSTILVFLYECM